VEDQDLRIDEAGWRKAASSGGLMIAAWDHEREQEREIEDGKKDNRSGTRSSPGAGEDEPMRRSAL